MMPFRAGRRLPSLFHSTAIAALMAAGLAPSPVVANADGADIFEAVAQRLHENHRYMSGVEQAMLAAPMRVPAIAFMAIEERPDLARQLHDLRLYVEDHHRKGGRYHPLYPAGALEPPKPGDGLRQGLADGSILYGVGAMAGFGVLLVAMGKWMDEEEKKAIQSAADPDDQGASKRPRNGTAPGRATDAGERANSTGAARVGAMALHDMGYTGEGVVIAAVDTGADSRHHEIHDSLDEAGSYNFIEFNHDIDDYDGHGTHVQALMVGARDGYGMHGVAYDARSLSFNAIAPVSEDGRTHNLSLSYVVRSYDLAIAAGADVINNSWGTRTNVENYTLEDFRRFDVARDFEAAARRLVAADGTMVFAAGNDHFGSPDLFAGLPVLLPELDGHWVVVGSVDAENNLSWFSNRCGVAKDFCLVAPGEMMLSAKSMDGQPGDAAEYIYMSGTSMAAPLVSGGVALLKQAFPELTSPEILDILFESATDLGEAGVDDVYGHGLMNLEAAVQPIGPLSLTGGDDISATRHGIGDSRLALGGGIGDAMADAMGNLSVMAIDDRGRGYALPGRDFVTAGSAPVAIDETVAFGQRHFQVAGVEDMAELEMPAGAGVGLRLGIGQGDHGAVAAYAGLEHRLGGTRVSAELGRVQEADTVLGAASSGAFGGGHSVTDTLRFGTSWEQGDLAWEFSSSLGWTDFAQGDIEVRGDGIVTSALAAGMAQRSLWAEGDRFAISLSTPLAVSGGVIEMTAPAARVAAEDGVVSTGIETKTTRVDLAPQRQPLDLAVSYDRPIGQARLKLDAGWRPGHDVGAATLGLYMEF